MKSLLGLLYNLFVDLKRLHPDVVGLDRDYLTIKARVEDEGIGFLTIALPALGKSFDRALSDGWMPHVAGFSRNKSLPKLFSGLTKHIFDIESGTLLDNPSIECILSVRQLCYLFKKYLPCESRVELLDYQAKKDFVELDASIRGIAPFRLDALTRLGSFLLNDLDEFTELDCRHGPGAVFEGYTPNQKWLEIYQGLLDMDPRLMSIGYDLPASLLGDCIYRTESNEDYPSTGCTRIVTVPKSSSALRTITVEPCLNQFVQQGYNAWLRDCISRDRALRQILVLSDQRPNQELALDGSRTGEWCTIDLSSASDLLSQQTIEALFASRPRFLSGILNCRTPFVEQGSSLVSMKKFAGMGNATTFPVQSVAFAAVALLAILGNPKELDYEKIVRASGNVQVYGDDIIVRSEHFRAVADWITCFGLKINRSKTFFKGNFRESCGVDAYGGTDVTPVYLRHDPDVTYKEPSSVESVVSASNQMWLRAYYHSAEFLRHTVEASLNKKLPLVRRGSAGLGWVTRFDESEVHRWHPTLHRFEVRTLVLVPKRRRDALSGYPALIKYFHHPKLGDDDPTHLSATVRKFSSSLRRRWVQV